MDSSENDEGIEIPRVADEPPSMEMDLTTPGDTPVDETPTPDTPPAPELAEPGVYVCIAENVGEHPQLGVLTFGEEYDYTLASAETLEAVAACVEGGYLEQVT